ncbi:hypothetical protein BH10PSE7_BH10PSE7_37630 [soil metagenome]
MKAISILSLIAVAAATFAGSAAAAPVKLSQSHIPKLVHKFVHPLDIHSGKAVNGAGLNVNPGVIKGFNPQPEPPRALIKGASH